MAQASQDGIVVSEGLELLQEKDWQPLTARCREALRPDGALVLHLAPDVLMEPRSLTKVLAEYFGAVEVFAWDGLWRTPARAGSEVFAICRPFLPYGARSLDLLRPRVVSSGPDWQSTWLCERPALPKRFLLRTSIDIIGECHGGVDFRLRFVTPERARFKVEGHLSDVASGTADLLLSSELAEARGGPQWAEVERVAIDIRTDSEEPVDVRISDVRIFSDETTLTPSVSRTSAHLRESYDASYYRGMPGYAQYREKRELRELINVHRAYALLLPSAPQRVVDVGSGRGELAEHLLERGTEVTLLDYSPAAMELAETLVGDRPNARFVVDDAANLASHVAEESQDAIFMTDFVEHLTIDELRLVLRACRRVLIPGGALIIHTPERYSGSIVTAKAIHGLHVNLFEVATLKTLLLEAFGVAEVFTWDGFERFSQRGYCIDLFAIARGQELDLVRPLSALDADRSDWPRTTRRTAWVAECPRLPSRFTFEATIDVSTPAIEGKLQISFLTASGDCVAQATRELSKLQTLPVNLLLASELLAPGSPAANWDAVAWVVVSTESRDGGAIEVTVANASLRTNCLSTHIHE